VGYGDSRETKWNEGNGGSKGYQPARYYIPLNEIGLAELQVEPTAGLIRLQNALFDAIGRFMGPVVPALLPRSRRH
jgi:hypothetical protein